MKKTLETKLPEPSKIKSFKKEIWNYYESNKRDLPWRNTTNPYHILVSEVMLQQTQVSRVIPKYKEFLKKFGTIRSLALASKADVLTIWQGLGYNRRALFLKKTCETLYAQNPEKPHFPTSKEELIKLPGIGQSTAGAILAFAFNKAEPFIETNIRAVFLYFFFKETLSVSDINICELIEKTLDKARPREWYYALYDYGSMLKAKLGKQKTSLHKQSKHYNKQSSFKGSNREIRSNILKLFMQNDSKKSTIKDVVGDASQNLQISLSEREIIKILTSKLSQANPENIRSNIQALLREGFITRPETSRDVQITKKSSKSPSKNSSPSYTLSVV
jgi:A/G-specific adenine glycosylase